MHSKLSFQDCHRFSVILSSTKAHFVCKSSNKLETSRCFTTASSCCVRVSTNCNEKLSSQTTKTTFLFFFLKICKYENFSAILNSSQHSRKCQFRPRAPNKKLAAAASWTFAQFSYDSNFTPFFICQCEENSYFSARERGEEGRLEWAHKKNIWQSLIGSSEDFFVNIVKGEIYFDSMKLIFELFFLVAFPERARAGESS